jgi:TolB protein
MKMNTRTISGLVTGLLFGGLAIGSAQNEITVTHDIDAFSQKPIWVSVSGISGEALQVLQFDLYVQGFGFTNADAAQYLISGSANGNFQGRATDRFNKSSLVAKAYSGAALRRQVHAFCDDFVQALSRKGIAQTKIAFKNDTGPTSEIFVGDFDGANATPVTKDHSIVAAPCWVPGQLALCYTSYKGNNNPDIYYHDLSTGRRPAIAHFSGLNTSPAVSPDGRHVAMILSKSGSPDVWVSDLEGGNLRQLTKTKEDESSPCWSNDGQSICFATKLNGRRVLAKVPASGGPIERIPTGGVLSPTEPDWSPDGKWIVFTAQMRDFQICVVPAKGGTATVLTTGEDPSWAPNSRTIIFAQRQSGTRVLSLLDAPTKQVKDVSRISGSNSQPSWAR